MKQARIQSVQCLSPSGLHRMAYKEWGNPENPATLVCVHGLTRVSDDFDALAEALCNDYRVICPDIVGRGRSDHLRDPLHYQVPQYVADMVTLIARLNVETVHWVGTSMGGLIGMALASLPATPIHRLVFNDIGPALNVPALSRIGEYVGDAVKFATLEQATEYVRQISLSFGPHSDAQWRKLAADVLRQDEDGKWMFCYDPALSITLRAMTPENVHQAEALLWAAYDAIACPTLLMRGAQSDLLSCETAQAMTQRGPKATVVEIPGVGHAPTLVDAAQIAIVKNFLLA